MGASGVDEEEAPPVEIPAQPQAPAQTQAEVQQAVSQQPPPQDYSQQPPPQGYPQQQPPQGYDPNYQQPYGQAPPGQYQQPYGQMPPGQYQQPYGQKPPHPSENVVSHQQPVEVSNYNYRSFDAPPDQANMVSADNLDLIMSVPIQISVELGRTQKKIKDIAELTLGNIVELDRQAGDQVDVIANGRLIARGDVVVVDDNYSVKITEIIKTKEELNNKN
jgi:flagellar motor switch protein FliN/FliY